MSTRLRAEMATTALVELAIDDVVIGGELGSYAILRRKQRTQKADAEVVVPLGAWSASLLDRLLSCRRSDRPTWHSLYVSSLAASGARVQAVELQVAAAAICIQSTPRQSPKPKRQSKNKSADVAIAAPLEAALLIALEARAPIYATTAALRELAASSGEGIAIAEPDHPHVDLDPDATLAAFLAELPDTDFGKWKM